MIKAQTLQSRLIQDAFFKMAMGVLSSLLMLPLIFILFYIFSHGISAFSWEFFTQLPKPVGEMGGGVSNAIIGSLLLILISALVAIPLGVFIGVYLSESRQGRIPEITRLCIDTLQGIPSIVMGIIAYTWIVMPLGSFSVLSGGIALALMMLPIVTKSTEETLKLIPDSLKEAAFALGAPYHTTILKVILPSGKSGIISGILLGIARVSGETAPLLFTAFGNPFMSVNIFKSANSLPLLIFNYATSPYQDWQRLAWGASLLLVLFVLSLSILAKVVVKK
ncbi:phosphate ABC transporter permease PtsA [Candidatus Marinamargulisbacteria bacterium SCGC AAA071-K20]|nr:phosphate ABC transporter permease PtsA [Candidatus Marinamargulisbacteria bacterium SCGC AAA071-K20]